MYGPFRRRLAISVSSSIRSILSHNEHFTLTFFHLAYDSLYHQCQDKKIFCKRKKEKAYAGKKVKAQAFSRLLLSVFHVFIRLIVLLFFKLFLLIAVQLVIVRFCRVCILVVCCIIRYFRKNASDNCCQFIKDTFDRPSRLYFFAHRSGRFTVSGSATTAAFAPYGSFCRAWATEYLIDSTLLRSKLSFTSMPTTASLPRTMAVASLTPGTLSVILTRRLEIAWPSSRLTYSWAVFFT